jgi:hypothetical protein
MRAHALRPAHALTHRFFRVGPHHHVVLFLVLLLPAVLLLNALTQTRHFFLRCTTREAGGRSESQTKPHFDPHILLLMEVKCERAAPTRVDMKPSNADSIEPPVHNHTFFNSDTPRLGPPILSNQPRANPEPTHSQPTANPEAVVIQPGF